MADGFMKDISACNKRSFPARHDQYCSTAGQGRLGPGWEAEPDIDVMEDMLFQVTTSNRLIQRRRPLPHLPGHFPGTEYLHCSCQIDRGRQEGGAQQGQALNHRQNTKGTSVPPASNRYAGAAEAEHCQRAQGLRLGDPSRGKHGETD
ncbi:hypothetical protein Bbelb_357520 [Branchiostoma belcheri]|nr:hypothetical protein Bbelb_357520 [Branchiostoma belcheri]